MSSLREENRKQMTQTILDTARTIMRENGVAALSMHELARRLEIRPPSLYNYFAGLMDIYDAVFRLGFTLFGEYVSDYVKAAQTWQEEIRLSLEAYMSFALKNPELYQICFERPIPGFVPSEESLQISTGQLNNFYGRIANLQGKLNTDLPPAQIADFTIAIAHGLTAMHMSNEPDLPLGQGRFGALIPAAVSALEKAWS